MLDQDHRRTAPFRDRVGEVPDLGVAEEMAVRHLLRSGFRRADGLLLAPRPEADERTRNRAELLRLVRIEVGLLDDFELAALRLCHEQQVDDADRSFVLQPLQLRHDLAPEARPVELEDEHLDRAEGCRDGAHDACRSFCFCWSNSASVRMP